MKFTTLLISFVLSFFSFVALANDKPVDTQKDNKIVGKVLEVLRASGYIYIKMEGADKAPIWAAAQEVEIKVGDYARIDGGNIMENFESKTLKRKFDKVYFTMSIETGKTADSLAEGKAPVANPHAAKAMPEKKAVDVKKVEKAKGGKTVAEVFAEKKALNTKSVKIRGQVVKYNAGIMGKNWIHLQDGSGSEGSNDLVVTSDASAEVGQVIEVEGKVVTDKDFGAGYKYDVIIEDAKIIKN